MSNSRQIASRFHVEELIGQGGMGEVFRGVDTQSGQPVAIKALKHDIVAEDPGLVERFQREGDALRQLNHPNIVKMLAAVEENHRHYLVMEYVDGGSLADLLREHTQLPVERVLHISLDLADALTRAHRLNIIHRDIKPANVLLAEDGTPRLTDFGVAHIGGSTRVTQTGAIIGTYAYLSPEAFNGELLDARADIWAFGVMLYEMLVGTPPFDKPHPGALLMAIMNDPVPDLQAIRPDVPDALADLIYRMLAKDRSQRIASVRLVGAELEALVRGEALGTSSVRPRISFDTPTPPTSAPASRHNLPAQTTPFVGREDELAEIARLLADPGVRLVTLLGPGGMGKTRLSLAAAEKFLDNGTGTRLIALDSSFVDGIYFVPLAPLNSPDTIVSTVAEATKFTFSGADDPKMQLLDYLREKHLLLVMDNFEHLIAGAGLVSEMLQASPGLKVLATSRERLRLSGENVLEVQGMRFPDYVAPADLEHYASAQLFLQSARRVRSDFSIDEQAAKYVTQIVRLVQGMPLGIELAAAWLEALSPQEIVAEIEKSYDFLETELRDVPERHRSIRAVFEYSWNLLNDDERDAFKRLSVFRGGFTREAAQEVAGASLKALTTLVNKSLLRRSPEGRYEVHELLRQYAAGRLADSKADEDAVRDRHSAYYADFLHNLESDLIGRNQKQARQAIEADFENVRTGFHWAVERGQFDSLNKSVGVLDIIYETMGLFMEGTAAFREAAEVLARHGADELLLARMRLYQGELAGRLGDTALNHQFALDALPVFQRHNAKSDMGLAYRNLAYAAMMQGQYGDSREYAEAGIAVSNELGSSWMLYMNLANLGYAVYLAGEYEKAKEIYQECLRLGDSNGNPLGMAYTRNNLGEILHAMGEEHEARRLYQEAHAIFKDIGYRRGMAFTLNNMGNVAHSLGDFEEAGRCNQLSLALMREIGDRRGIAEALNRLGGVTYSQGRYRQAMPYHQEAREIYQAIGDLRGLANSLALLSVVHAATGTFDEGIALGREGLELRRKIGNPADIADSVQFQGFLRALAGRNVERSFQFYDEALEVMNAAGAFDPQIFGRDQMFRGFSSLIQREFAAAKSHFENLLARIESSGVQWAVIQICFGLAWANWGLRDYEAAKISARRSLQTARNMHALPWGIANIGVLAHIVALEGQPERAVECLSCAYHHVDIAYFMKQLTNEAMSDLEQKLPADVYAAAIERGKRLNLDDVVADLLAD